MRNDDDWLFAAVTTALMALAMLCFLMLQLAVSGCARIPARIKYYPLDADLPCGWCASVSSKPGHFWETSQQFTECKTAPDHKGKCDNYQPELQYEGSDPIGSLLGTASSVALP
jgi:hypothetical protein